MACKSYCRYLVISKIVKILQERLINFNLHLFIMKDYTKIYTIIFWLSLLSIFIWLILKVLGIINTPQLIELLPYFSAVFGAGAFFQMIRDIKDRLNKLESENNKGFKEFEPRINILDKRVAILEPRHNL